MPQEKKTSSENRNDVIKPTGIILHYFILKTVFKWGHYNSIQSLMLIRGRKLFK
jgi:hypothetical protein